MRNCGGPPYSLLGLLTLFVRECLLIQRLRQAVIGRIAGVILDSTPDPSHDPQLLKQVAIASVRRRHTRMVSLVELVESE